MGSQCCRKRFWEELNGLFHWLWGKEVNRVSMRQKGHLGAEGGVGEESQELWGASMGQKRWPVGGDWRSKWGNRHLGSGRRARGGTGDSRGQKKG